MRKLRLKVANPQRKRGGGVESIYLTLCLTLLSGSPPHSVWKTETLPFAFVLPSLCPATQKEKGMSSKKCCS